MDIVRPEKKRILPYHIFLETFTQNSPPQQRRVNLKQKWAGIILGCREALHRDGGQAWRPRE
jgi:hypothetical protein